MANSRIMLTCKHCGEQLCIGKGNFGSYWTNDKNVEDSLNKFYREHQMGECCEEPVCSDDAKDHFLILEECDPLDDVNEVVRCEKCVHWTPVKECHWPLFADSIDRGECKKLGEIHYSERCITLNDHYCGYGERKE